MEIINEQHSQEEKTDQYLIQGEGNGKPQGSPGFLQTRRTSSSYTKQNISDSIPDFFRVIGAANLV